MIYFGVTDELYPEPIFLILFEWLEGTFIPTSAQDEALAARLGRFIGRLHQHSRTFSRSHQLTRRQLDADGIFDWDAIYYLKQLGRGIDASHRCYQVRSYSSGTNSANQRLRLAIGYAIHPEARNDDRRGAYFVMPLRRIE